MRNLKVGDRVVSRMDPDRQGTVVKVYSYQHCADGNDWVDVRWDKPVLPKQFGDVTSSPVTYLELV